VLWAISSGPENVAKNIPVTGSQWKRINSTLHGNRLIKANIRTADELWHLWESPKVKDKLQQRNRNVELIPSYAENTDILDQYLQDNEEDSDSLDDTSEMHLEMSDVTRNNNLKRKREILDEIIVQRQPPPHRF